MNNRGQVISIIAFFAIMLSVFILAVLLISMVNTILDPVEVQLGNMSDKAGESVGAISNSFNKWWDIFILVLFFLNVVLLLLTSFMVDIHPAFLLLYIVSALFLIIFGGNMVTSLADLWSDTGSFSNGVAEMPMVVWILNHWTLVIFSLIIVSGIIMYAKFKYANGGGNY